MEIYDVIIIGGGVSGLTASIYTSRAYIKTLNLAGFPSGGQLMWTTEVENFPGFPDGVLGPELIEKMRKQAEKYGTHFVDENVVSLSKLQESELLFEIKTDSNSVFRAKSIIIAVGSSPNKLGLASEEVFSSRGVSYCAVCDGAFFKEKVVGVVGGGDSAMEEASYLSKYAKEVYIFVRGLEKDMKASKIMIDRAKNNPKIKFVMQTEVKEFIGTTKLEKVLLKHLDGPDTELFIDGVFIAIGWKPNTSFLGDLIEKDPLGYIKVTDHTKTSENGIYVCGDSADPRYRQAITAAGTGAMSAIDVERFLSH
jgi:thioredoxin reductase (NADPH)